ncbi:hypothetical protein K438DRAFT_1582454 [Mycena galopus ATCC 62051]|nr:hypothetical protein K438DRAFT_1582454 [Mycena galopus ATCC 62051]
MLLFCFSSLFHITFSSTPRPIVDRDGKVCALYGGMPDDEGFMTHVHDPAGQALEAAWAQASLSYERLHHRRGNFAQVSGGDSYWGGQLQPGALVNGVINSAIFAALIALPAFQRLAGFATGLFANWAPNVFDFYIDYMSIFYKKYDQLSPPFQNSIWSACTFNLGPRTCTLGHRDFANLVFRWCSITALGNFDFTRGGHLILWDCKLVLEFPPGTTILSPSAAILHSNIPIAAGERRYSFTQYTAGGLFRWVEHGFQIEEEFFETLTDAEAKQEERLGSPMDPKYPF